MPYTIKNSLTECCLILYLCYSCSTLCKATLIVISGYGFIPSAFKMFYYRRNSNSGKNFGIMPGHSDDMTLITLQDNERVMEVKTCVSSSVVHWKK